MIIKERWQKVGNILSRLKKDYVSLLISLYKFVKIYRGLWEFVEVKKIKKVLV